MIILRFDEFSYLKVLQLLSSSDCFYYKQVFFQVCSPGINAASHASPTAWLSLVHFGANQGLAEEFENHKN